MVGRPASRPRRPSLRTIALGAVALAALWLVFNFVDVWLASRSTYESVTLETLVRSGRRVTAVPAALTVHR